uniref:Uncharacterized protein n=1 Tax=Triticum urartu TaxID=4572 RepID=A0A8R7QQU0_TRIUA
MNLRNHAESCMTSLLAMIDSHNANNVNSCNEMIGCAVSKVADFKLRVAGGEISFVKSHDSNTGAVPDVKVKSHVPEAEGPSTSRLVNPNIRKRLGTDLLSSLGAAAGVVHARGSASGNTGQSDVIPDARTLFGPFPSPESLDLNRRASLREVGSTSVGIGNVARRLDLNLVNDVCDFINGTPFVGPMNPMPVDTNLTIGPSPFREPTAVLRPPALTQSNLFGWFAVAPPNKRPRMTTDYSIANPVGVAVSEMEGRRRDELFYAMAMDSSVNDLSRVWFKHGRPYLIEMTGEEVLEEFCVDKTLAQKGLDSILHLGICPPASGRLIIGPDWAFKVSYTRGHWRRADVRAMFNQLPPGVKCELGLVVVYLGQGWSLYVFDTLRRVLHVIDPNICKPAESQMKAKHLQNAEELLDALVKCGDMFWGEGKVPHNGWSYCFHATCTYESSDTAMQVVHHIINFVPGQHPMNLTASSSVALKKKLLRAILMMVGNTGSLPRRVEA